LSIFSIILKLAGLVSVNFVFYAVKFFLADYFSGKFEPEMIADRKEKEKRREFFQKKYPGMTYRDWKIKKLNERRLELVFKLEHEKANKRKRDFFG